MMARRKRPAARSRRRTRTNGKRRTLRLQSEMKTATHDGRARSACVQSLREFLRAYGVGEEGREDREAFAARCGTSLAYLIQLGLGFRRCAMDTALAIEKASHGIVRAEDLCPQADWAYLTRRSLAAARANEAITHLDIPVL